MSKESLTAKQRLFVESYLANGFNAAGAARLAGYKGNDITLAAVGYENLRKPHIAVLVEERLKEAAMGANEVLARLTMMARGSLADVLTEEGEFDLADARRRGVDYLLKKMKTRKNTRRTSDDEEVEDVTHEYEIHDAQAALVHLGKFHRLFIETHELTGKDGGAIRVSKAEDLTDDELAAIANK